ncbi:MAG: hypothetical protein ACOC1U_00155, partial [Spirochaetota bacterium]
ERAGAERDALEEQLALLEKRVDEHRQVVNRIERFQAIYDRSDAPAAEPPFDQLELLETKLLILRIVGSEAIRTDYPDLYEQLNEYLDALVAEQRAAATDETMREINRLLTDLTNRSDEQLARIESFAEEYPVLSTTERTTDFLSRLRSASELR